MSAELTSAAPRPPSRWQPVRAEELQHHLGAFTDWVLCGGHSVDLIAGHTTRAHGDIDIGVFRSDLLRCLRSFEPRQVYLCRPPSTHLSWDGGEIDPAIHDLWIADATHEHWLLQVMVFDDEGDQVIYRRNPRIGWPKRSHAVVAGGMPVLNPLITFLFKANKTHIDDREIADLITLITHCRLG